MRLTDLAHRAVRAHLADGATAVDATAGNGHDTLFLAQHIGAHGQVYAIDIQPEAIAATRRRLQQAGCHQQVSLHQGCHSELDRRVPSERHRRVAAVMFNLGYLPGGDQRLTSTPDTTLAAIDAALRVLAGHGVLSVIAYRGHVGGRTEAAAVAARMQCLTSDWSIEQHEASAPGPVLWLLRPRRPDPC